MSMSILTYFAIMDIYGHFLFIFYFDMDTSLVYAKVSKKPPKVKRQAIRHTKWSLLS